MIATLSPCRQAPGSTRDSMHAAWLLSSSPAHAAAACQVNLLSLCGLHPPRGASAWAMHVYAALHDERRAAAREALCMRMGSCAGRHGAVTAEAAPCGHALHVVCAHDEQCAACGHAAMRGAWCVAWCAGGGGPGVHAGPGAMVCSARLPRLLPRAPARGEPAGARTAACAHACTGRMHRACAVGHACMHAEEGHGLCAVEAARHALYALPRSSVHVPMSHVSS